MTESRANGKAGFIEKLRYAFGIGYEEPGLSEIDKSAICRFGGLIVSRRMEIPAIMALESLRPMNFLASQVMVMMKPFVGFVTDDTFYGECQQAFEKRESVSFLIEYLEDRLNERQLAEKAGLSAIGASKESGERGVDEQTEE